MRAELIPFHIQNVATLRPSGDIDLREMARVRLAIAGLLSKDQVNVVIDLRGVDWINPLAAGALLASKAQLVECGGDLRIAGAGKMVAAIIKRYGMLAVFEAYSSVEDAIASFDSEMEIAESERVQ